MENLDLEFNLKGNLKISYTGVIGLTVISGDYEDNLDNLDYLEKKFGYKKDVAGSVSAHIYNRIGLTIILAEK